MPNNDHVSRPGGASGDGVEGGGLRRRLARLRAALQDELACDDEKWAAERGYECWRSSSGWTFRARDPRFGLRHECAGCRGSGRLPITGAECVDCAGTGVVTLGPEDGVR